MTGRYDSGTSTRAMRTGTAELRVLLDVRQPVTVSAARSKATMAMAHLPFRHRMFIRLFFRRSEWDIILTSAGEIRSCRFLQRLVLWPACCRVIQQQIA